MNIDDYAWTLPIVRGYGNGMDISGFMNGISKGYKTDGLDL